MITALKVPRRKGDLGIRAIESLRLTKPRKEFFFGHPNQILWLQSQRMLTQHGNSKQARAYYYPPTMGSAFLIILCDDRFSMQFIVFVIFIEIFGNPADKQEND